MASYELPEWVKIYKTKGRCIKMKNGKYYLYSQKNIYDKSKHKGVKKEVYLGRITEEHGLIAAKVSKNIIQASNFITKKYGAYALFNFVCDDILQKLVKYFGEDGKLIFVIACLRAEEKTVYSEIEDVFNESYFSTVFPNLSVSQASLSKFLNSLSSHKSSMISFMKDDIEEDDILIFDGTNILCGSQYISYVGYGYKHGHNYASQVNELYAYSYSKKKPVYYKLLEGSVSDKANLTDILNEASINNCIALVDNGFESSDNIKGLLSNKNKYIMALKRSSKLVPDEFLKDITGDKAKQIFLNNHETIFAYETIVDNDRICVYFNQTIRGVEMSEYIDKMNNEVKNYTKDNFIQKQERFGIYVLKTNVMDKGLKEIYEYYKSRFEIEYMFDTVKNTLNFDKSFMKGDKSLESWAFINHISILITQEVYNFLQEKKIDISLHQFYKKLRQIKVQSNKMDKEREYALEHIPKEIRDLVEKLDINLENML